MKNDSTLPAAVAGQPPCKHTPGPWRIDYNEHRSPNIWVHSDHNSGIAKIEVCDYGDGKGHVLTEEDHANARLIAAAPELLDALRSVWGLIESGQLQRNTSADANPDWAMRQIPFVMALKKMQMAIDKADGVSSQGSPDGEPPQGPPEKD